MTYEHSPLVNNGNDNAWAPSGLIGHFLCGAGFCAKVYDRDPIEGPLVSEFSDLVAAHHSSTVHRNLTAEALHRENTEKKFGGSRKHRGVRFELVSWDSDPANPSPSLSEDMPLINNPYIRTKYELLHTLCHEVNVPMRSKALVESRVPSEGKCFQSRIS